MSGELAAGAMHFYLTGRTTAANTGTAQKQPPAAVFATLFGEPSSLVARAEGFAVRRHRRITSVRIYLRSTGASRPTRRSAQHQTLFPTRNYSPAARPQRALMQVEAPAMLHIATRGCFLGGAPRSAGSQTRTVALAPACRPSLVPGWHSQGNLNQKRRKKHPYGAGRPPEPGGPEMSLTTNIGEVKNSEESMVCAPLTAGAETLVMSLWPVSDRVTRIMTSYYGPQGRLGRGKRSGRHSWRCCNQGHSVTWSGNWKSLNGR